MKSQFDNPARVVSLENLKAMCELTSGVCHRYCIEKVTPNRVYVQYSNPDEYGNEYPMTAVFPCYPGFDRNENIREEKNPSVVLDIIRVIRDRLSGEGWQCFDAIINGPKMIRSPEGIWEDVKEFAQPIIP